MRKLCPGGGSGCNNVSFCPPHPQGQSLQNVTLHCLGEQGVLEFMVFSYFQKNLEFLHTDEIIRWFNYAESFADGGSSSRKVKYGR